MNIYTHIENIYLYRTQDNPRYAIYVYMHTYIYIYIHMYIYTDKHT